MIMPTQRNRGRIPAQSKAHQCERLQWVGQDSGPLGLSICIEGEEELEIRVER